MRQPPIRHRPLLAALIGLASLVSLFIPAGSAAADSNPGPTVALSAHSASAGDSLTVSSAGWDPGTTVSFSTDPANAPAAIADALTDDTGAITDFSLTIPADTFAPGSISTWTISAAGTASGLAASASDSAQIATAAVPVVPDPADYAFSDPAATTVKTITVNAATLGWSATPDASANETLSEYRGLAAGGVCPAVISAKVTQINVADPGVTVAGLAANYCYRFGLTVSHDGASFTITSGILRILAGVPRVPVWHGRFDTYRAGSFTTQATGYWCVPAAIEMMINIDTGAANHASATQRAYYAYGRPRRANLFNEPGLDPQAWALTLDHYGPVAYHVITARTLAGLLSAAASRIRLTGYPAGIIVGSGSHAWIMTGFAANRDPGVTSRYTVSGIYASGPLWPRQRYRFGYFDSPPDHYFSVATLARLYGTYRDPDGRTRWDHLYVAIVP